MNAKIKYTCTLTIPDVNLTPDVEEARQALEGALRIIADDVTITEYEQEFTDES